MSTMASAFQCLQAAQEVVNTISKEATAFFGASIFETRIGAFILSTWVVMAVVLLCSFASFEEACTVPRMAGGLNILFALAQAAFAYYLHRILVARVGPSAQDHEVKDWIMQHAIEEATMLPYPAVFMASLVFNFVVAFFMSCAESEVAWASWFHTIVMILYHVVTLGFLVVWFNDSLDQQILEPVRQWGKRKQVEVSAVPAAQRVGVLPPVESGAVCIARKECDIFVSSTLAEKVGSLQPGQQITAAGPSFEDSGRTLVPVRPNGVVELSCLYVRPSKSRSQNQGAATSTAAGVGRTVMDPAAHPTAQHAERAEPSSSSGLHNPFQTEVNEAVPQRATSGGGNPFDTDIESGTRGLPGNPSVNEGPGDVRSRPLNPFDEDEAGTVTL